ncbi:hypothetical protein [Streptomyces triculaminicus]|uniref:hypothetical protein n=1 Tax=Streptomyces triculaminicus TaxID=2816232 RepID=UPI0037CEC3BB
MRKISGESIRSLLTESECPSLKLVPAQTMEAILRSLDDFVDVCIASSETLSENYWYRYTTIDAVREGRFGWNEFFEVLESAPRVGMFWVRAIDWNLIVLTDEEIKSTVACLVRPPDSFTWPPGAAQL